MIEWEVILNCNYTCNYCNNSRNSALPTPIPYEKDKDKVFGFIEILKEQHPDVELFLFGGEPFLHPFFGEIIQKLHEVEMKFIIQTNFSITKKVEEIGEAIQVSVHPTEIKDKATFIENVEKLKHLIRRIDIMYTGEESLKYFIDLVKVYPREQLFIVPVADFKFTKGANELLYEYNELRKGFLSKVYNFEEGDRSTTWEEQAKGMWSPKGNPCGYIGKYKLFDPMLRQYSCSYRENNIICPNDQCFLM